MRLGARRRRRLGADEGSGASSARQWSEAHSQEGVEVEDGRQAAETLRLSS